MLPPFGGICWPNDGIPPPAPKILSTCARVPPGNVDTCGMLSTYWHILSARLSTAARVTFTYCDWRFATLSFFCFWGSLHARLYAIDIHKYGGIEKKHNTHHCGWGCLDIFCFADGLGSFLALLRRLTCVVFKCQERRTLSLSTHM